MSAPSVLRHTAVVGAFTTLSRALGFVREILMAVYFGTSLAKSAFDVAFRIPNLFRRLFGEGALSAAFVPVFSAALHREGPEAANRLAGRIMTMLALSLLLVTAGAIGAISLVLRTWTLGERAAAVLPLLRVMLPYMFFICMVALCMGILNSHHHFAVPAVTPVVLNLVWIAVLVLACRRSAGTPLERVHALAWGILLAGLLQLLMQIPALLRFGFRPRFSLAWNDPGVRRVLTLMAPAALGMGLTQVNVVIDGVLALAVGKWAPAALTYAERLIYFPLGIFATALGTVLLPTFARQAARDRGEEVVATLNDALCNLLLVMMPAAVGLFVLARPAVDLVFTWRGGLFDPLSAARTTRALLFYAPGLLLFSIYKMFVPAFYAMQDTRTPVRIGMRMVLLNFSLNVVFILTWPAEWKHAGLALATVIASGTNSLVLALILQRRIGTPDWTRVGGVALRVSLAAAVMGGAVRWLHAALAGSAASWKLAPKAVELLSVAGGILGGVLLYGALLLVVCRGELRRVVRWRG